MEDKEGYVISDEDDCFKTVARRILHPNGVEVMLAHTYNGTATNVLVLKDYEMARLAAWWVCRHSQVIHPDNRVEVVVNGKA